MTVAYNILEGYANSRYICSVNGLVLVWKINGNALYLFQTNGRHNRWGAYSPD